MQLIDTEYWSVRKAVSYRGLFTAGWFGVREKHGSRLKIYDRLRANEHAVYVHGYACHRSVHNVYNL